MAKMIHPVAGAVANPSAAIEHVTMQSCAREMRVSDVIAFLRQENRVVRAQLHGRHLRTSCHLRRDVSDQHLNHPLR
jgi:hypothetical protein